ncbi:hypothetical protein [Chitinophaga sp. 212800010-3]|uniref:hypothetical protein n=1 Tax=unclassified Chitinophaga TaxID=2619133 RepID=UPI002DED6A16|nr:hypothetical protein [Chitinophaga sp. 212800010-3]
MEAKGVQNKVEGNTASMEELSFSSNEFALFWTQGSVYTMGFRRGLLEWKKFIKNGGRIAVIECSWLTDKRPYNIDFIKEKFY